MTLAEELQSRFGRWAVVDISPYFMGEDDWRWTLRIDGETIPGLEVITRQSKGAREGVIDVVVVDEDGREMLAFDRFPSEKAGSVLRTLGELK